MVNRERMLKGTYVLDQEAACFIRLEKPFVGIQHSRISTFDST